MKQSQIQTTLCSFLLRSLLLGSPALLPAVPAHAQTPAAASDPAFEAAKRSWDGLSEADRRGIQDGLIWTGDYKGVVDGEFGRGTRAAIVAYAQRTGLPTDGTLDQRGRSVLAAAAALVRNAAGFAPLKDPKTGVTLSLPTKLLPRRTDTAQGSRWSAADGSVILETSAYPASAGDLPGIFEALKDSTPQRKVTYRLLRPDFLVVSGEIGRSIFYTRIAKPPVDQPAQLRGYTLTYPSGVKALDSISIAIANGWVPFPPPGGVPARPNVAGVPASTGPAGAGQVPLPPGPPSRPVAVAGLGATGIAVAADKVLTVYGRCIDPRIAGRPATVLKRDEDSGTTLLQVAGLTARPFALRAGTAGVGEAALAIFLTRKGTGPETEAVVAPGDIVSAAGASQRKRVLAPIQAEGQGGPVFNRGGLLIGLAGRTQAPRLVAGIVPQRAWPLVEPAVLSAILAAGSVTLPAEPAVAAGDRAAADLAPTVRPSLMPVFCSP